MILYLNTRIIIFTLALVFAYIRIVVVRRVVAERQTGITLIIVFRTHVVLWTHRLAARLLQRQSAHGLEIRHFTLFFFRSTTL